MRTDTEKQKRHSNVPLFLGLNGQGQTKEE